MTHLLTGACLGRSGFNRKTAYATLAMTLAAEAPDADVIWGFGGPVAGFCHHRGITHTLIGAPVMALLITGVVWLLARFRRRPPLQPVRWGWIWLLALVADGSHLLLDYTNTYGLRPLFPFDPHWYAGSIEFIFDPVMFGLLLLGLVVPALLGLVEGEMRRRPRGALRGRGWAIAALVGVGVLWGVRGVEHARAIALVRAEGSPSPEPLLRVAAGPSMADPFLWHALTETRASYGLATVSTLDGRVAMGQVVGKPPVTPAVAVAKQSYLGRVYGDWSSWPVVEDVGEFTPPGASGAPAPATRGAHTVEFRDLRFAPEALGPLGGRDEGGVLSGWVTVDAEGKVAGEWMDGREQR